MRQKDQGNQKGRGETSKSAPAEITHQGSWFARALMKYRSWVGMQLTARARSAHLVPLTSLRLAFVWKCGVRRIPNGIRFDERKRPVF